MSLSDPYSYSEESPFQRSGCSPESPISLASSPASSASTCDTLLVYRAEELEGNSGLDFHTGEVAPNSTFSHIPGNTATIPPVDNGDRIRALMAKYEQVMSADGAQMRCASSDSQPFEGADLASLPDSHSHDDRNSRDDRNGDKPTKRDAPQRNHMSQKTRYGKKVQSRARNRVQNKSASVSRHQPYAFNRLGGARRAASGAIEYEVHWAPTWLPLGHFEGDDAVQEAKDLVVNLFGSDAWQKEAQRLELRL
ncbi:hypothetical protein V2A60_002387 [Cordyceps javanica]